MKKFQITFNGRLNGAIGTTYGITAVRDGIDPEAARVALYDEFEQIHYCRFKEINNAGLD